VLNAPLVNHVQRRDAAQGVSVFSHKTSPPYR
jgi:hypothetical protein